MCEQQSLTNTLLLSFLQRDCSDNVEASVVLTGVYLGVCGSSCLLEPGLKYAPVC